MTQSTTLNQCPQSGSPFPDGARYLAGALVMMTTASSDITIHLAFTSRTSQALLFDAAFRHSLYVLRKRRKGGVKYWEDLERPQRPRKASGCSAAKGTRQ